MDHLIGRTLGPYELVEWLGAGAMGAVYRAAHRLVPLQRAIKVLPAYLTDRDSVERFRRAAGTALGLRHPNIVQVHDVGEQDGVHYIVMDLAEGISLAQRLEEGPLPQERAVRLLRQLAAALDYAHARGVIHRDVKPANALVGSDDHLTLVDFGIAREVEGTRQTHAGLVIGTAEYLAPEVLKGRSGGKSADLYALGIVAYELLTGRVPFAGETMAILYAHVHDLPPRPSSLRPDLPRSVDRPLLRQLEKDPDQRYRTAEEFVAELARAVQSAMLIEEAREALRRDDVDRAGRLVGEVLAADPVDSDARGVHEAVGARRHLLASLAEITRLLDAGDSRTALERIDLLRDADAAEVAPLRARVEALRDAQTVRIPPPRPLPETGRMPRTPSPPPRRRAARWPVGVLGLVAVSGLVGTLVGVALHAGQTGRCCPLPGFGPDPPPPSAPTGTVVLVRRNRLGNDDLYRLDLADRTTAEFATPGSVSNWAPASSPDGQQIAFATNTPGQDDIAVMGREGSGRRIVARSGTLRPGSPCWTPDGRVAFHGEANNAWEVYALPATGGEPDQLTQTPTIPNTSLCTWPTGGGPLAFAGKQASVWSIFVESPPKTYRPITSTNTDSYAPAWAPDGQRLAFQQGPEGRTAIVTAAPDGSAPRVVVPVSRPEWARSPAWSPDGRWIAYVSNREASVGPSYGDLYIVAADGGAPERLTSDGLTYDWRPAWLPADPSRSRFAGSGARISDPSPPLGSELSASVRLVRDGHPVPEAETRAILHFRTVDERWPPDGTSVRTDANGEATIPFKLDYATPGHPVSVDLVAEIEGEPITLVTSFTPSARTPADAVRR